MENSIFLTTDLSIVPEAVTPDIRFADFYRLYCSDMEGRLKQTTLARKNAIICDKVLPVFASLPMSEITPHAIRQWQNSLISQNYSDTYLKTIDMHLFSIFKYGAKYYDLPNPYDRAEHMGSASTQTMRFWTLEQYCTFIRQFENQPKIFISFEILYWCGIRVGELLALTPQDIDVKKHLLKITKTYVRHNRRDIISSPKTENSVRNVAVPDFLFAEIMDYISVSNCRKNERLIPHSCDFLKYHLQNGCKRSGVPQIRIHDIRHSHVSLLINQGFTAIAIAERMGHKHISTTMNVYAHLFPNRQELLVETLEKIHSGEYPAFIVEKEEKYAKNH